MSEKSKVIKTGNIYYDVRSGLRTEQRKGLAKMLRQAEKGKIDLILTKSISRLARNTVDVLEATRMLKDKGVTCFSKMRT